MISKEGKEELALALFLWKEFKSQGKTDLVVHKQMFEMARHLGVEEELVELLKKFIWPLEIKIKE